MASGTLPTIEEIRDKVVPILKRHGATRAGIFGSCARGEMHEDSDVDILVELPNRSLSLLDIVVINHELEEEIGRKVDLVEYSSVKRHIKEGIERDEVRIL